MIVLKRFLLACACCASLASARSVLAQPVTLLVEEKTSTAAAAAGLRTCNVYVQMMGTTPEDNVLSVGFSHIVTDSPTGFYQDAFGSDKPPNPALCVPFPLLCSDSFVTIGLKDGANPNAGAISVDGDWNNILFNCNPTIAPCPNGALPGTLGGWFNANPPNMIGNPTGPNNTVLLGQFTVPNTANVFTSPDLRVFSGAGFPAFFGTFNCFGGGAPCETNPALCDDANVCTTDTCDPDNPAADDDGCVNTNNSVGCDDGLFCNGVDACSGGTCVHPGDPCTGGGECANSCNETNNNCFNANGVACGSPSDTECDNPDTCNGAGMCLANNAPNGTACSDGLFCNGADTCGGGTCSVHPGDPCTAGGECANSCNEAADNCFDAANTPCGNPKDSLCTDPDTCDGAGVCQMNNAANGTTCAGGTCQGGTCMVGCTSNAQCSDGILCTDDVCNLATGQCSNPNNTVSCPDGLFCNGGDTCSGGVCVHAGDPCAVGGDCANSCNEAADNCFDLANTPCGSPTNTDCDNADTCNGTGVCQPNNEANGTQCPGGTCQGGVCSLGCTSGTQCPDGNDCTLDVCTAGVCSNPPAGMGVPCGSSNNTDCDNIDTCNGAGVCLPNNEPNGTPCTADANDCTNDVCGGGVCTHPNAPAGTMCGSQNNTDCDNPDQCNASGVCQPNNEPNGTPCTADANQCTSDVCGGGVCTHPNAPAGTMCGDGGSSDCDNPDTCNASGVCLVNNDADGTPCATDGNDCTSDVCGAGLCTHPNAPAGTACGSNADTDCTNPDTCNASGTCLPNNAGDGTPCNGGAGSCMGGVCGGCTSGAQCPDGNACTNDVCTAGVCSNPPSAAGTACGSNANTDCDNPDTCNGSGACLPNNEPDGTVCTSDNVQCTADVCSNAVCTHPPSSAGTRCGSGADSDCDNPDTCDGAGACSSNNAPNGITCDDAPCAPGQSCACQAGACQATGGGCTSDDECEDHNPCTDDACVAGDCENVPNSNHCDDGNFCTENEVCSGGACKGGTRVECNDGNPCNGKETCNPTIGCIDGVDLNCNDGNECTMDGCDPVSGCVNTAECHFDADCDDGNPESSDTCTLQGCCEHSVGGVQYPLDIKHGKCPNKFKPHNGPGNGPKLKVHIAGASGADVHLIDLGTIRLGVCGEDGSIAPAKSPKFKDKVTPFFPQSCEGGCGCHKKKKDYIDDVELEFKVSQVTNLIGSVADGTLVHLEVFGELHDGTPFTATDCVIIDVSGSGGDGDGGDEDEDDDDGVEFPLDILKGKCPNEIKGNSGGKVEVHLAGTADLSVAMIDWSSIGLRECGADGSILPAETPKVEDKVTPFYPQSCTSNCGCHVLQNDGKSDLKLKFNIPEIMGLLGQVRNGSVVHLEVFGELTDGTPFKAQDCALIKLPSGAH